MEEPRCPGAVFPNNITLTHQGANHYRFLKTHYRINTSPTCSTRLFARSGEPALPRNLGSPESLDRSPGARYAPRPEVPPTSPSTVAVTIPRTRQALGAVATAAASEMTMQSGYGEQARGEVHGGRWKGTTNDNLREKRGRA